MSEPSAPNRKLDLTLPPVDEIRQELVAQVDNVIDAELTAAADAFVAELLASGKDAPDANQQRQRVDEMGSEIQRHAAWRSAMLQEPIHKLAKQGEDGGPVAQSLLDLRGKMEELDPRNHNLSTGFFDRLVSIIPGMGNRMQRYFRKFETAQEALDTIIKDLRGGADMLRRDNLTLSDDQNVLRQVIVKLARQVELGRLIDKRLETSASDLSLPVERQTFIQEELLFPLRQRIVDLQQQLAISQQGILALEVIIRNNRELMRGVDRAVNVTVSALSVAVTVALALANQRLVLDRVESINKTTSDLIAGTAQALRTQGVDIQNRASSAMLDMEKLEQAFADVVGAVEEVSRYRREALPRLDEQINRLDDLARKGSIAIERLNEGNMAQPDIALLDAKKTS